MKWVCAIALSCACLLSSNGCSGAPGSAGSRWIARHGGICDADDARLQRVAGPMLGHLGKGVSVQVLTSDVPGAYSWPDGRIYVTRGLLRLLSDDQLAAAVAHEAGHLLDNGHLNPVGALHGTHVLDAETRADRIGMELLIQFGRSPSAMLDMLSRLRESGQLKPKVDQALAARIERLRK